MTRISVSLPDPVAAKLQALAGDDRSLSGVAADLLRQALLERACAAAAAYDRDHDDPEWEQARLAGRA
jgi:hypothetical protein